MGSLLRILFQISIMGSLLKDPSEKQLWRPGWFAAVAGKRGARGSPPSAEVKVAWLQGILELDSEENSMGFRVVGFGISWFREFKV